MKQLIINSQSKSVPDEVDTVQRLVEFLNIPTGGTGIAVNNRIIVTKNWNVAEINNGDNITIISAAFGG